MATNFGPITGDLDTGVITTATGTTTLHSQDWPIEEPTLELANGEAFHPSECINPWPYITIAADDINAGNITIAPSTSNPFVINGQGYTGATTVGTTTTDVEWSNTDNSLTWTIGG